MDEHVGFDVLVNWAVMLRSDKDGAILFADDGEEGSFYGRCKHASAEVLPANGSAMRLLEAVQALGIEGMAAAVRGQRTELPESVFQPSLGDVASLLLQSSAYDVVIQDTGGTAWVGAAEKTCGSLRARCAWVARLVSMIGASGRGVEPALTTGDLCNEAVEWSTLDVDWSVVEAIVGEERRRELETVPPAQSLGEALGLCDGMVALEVLAMATQRFRPRGIPAAMPVSVREFASRLRVAFDLKELERDEMYCRIKRWEYRHQGRYPLLRNWKELDPLGVLIDQRYWRGDLNWLLSVVGRDGHLATLLLDLDEFKGVNEALGHTGGDEALRRFLRVVKELTAGVAEAYRRGGDEVIVFAPNCEPEEATRLAERIRQSVETDLLEWSQAHDLKRSPTASIGVVVAPGHAAADEIVGRVEEAQHEAKKRGKNCVVFASLP